MSTIDYSVRVETLTGEETDLSAYRGQVMLIVNTASHCGFTPQFQGLQKLHEKLGGLGLAVLGFPTNQFGRGEPGEAEDTVAFCETNYGVTFPMFSKIEVNGSNAHPLFQQLKVAAPGILGTEGIKWNFTKFLIASDGTIVKRFGPHEKPESLESQLLEQLQA